MNNNEIYFDLTKLCEILFRPDFDVVAKNYNQFTEMVTLMNYPAMLELNTECYLSVI
jgi:hypothetical protein